MAVIIETDRLILREIEESDAAFINTLLNTPAFMKYIGDRGVRSDEDARWFIAERYRASYAVHGYGLLAVLLKPELQPIGMCGFVKRDWLPGPDIGFAFLPEHERKGYGYESATAVLDHGHDDLNFDKVFAITTPDNTPSERLLVKLGFVFEGMRQMPDGEELKLFSREALEK
jgi:RimJ/RimL family protein N-acetyltransferase